MIKTAWRQRIREGIRNVQSGVVVASPDSDGLCCALLLSELFGLRLGGVYTTTWLLLFDGTTVQQACDGLWVDHDVFDPRITNFGQHLINFSAHDTALFSSNLSFNPNEHFGQVFADSFRGCRPKKRDKYPFGTVHYLLDALDVPFPEWGSRQFTCLAHSDGTWANFFKYPLNCQLWSVLMFSESAQEYFYHLGTDYGRRENELLAHKDLVLALQEAGVSRRGSQTSCAEYVPREWRAVQGSQGKTFRSGTDVAKYLADLRRIICILSDWTGWRGRLPETVTCAIRGETDTDYPNKVQEQGLDQFMSSNRVFSHAIKGFREIRFTRSFLDQ